MEKTKVEAGAGTALKAGMFGAFGVSLAGVIITIIMIVLLCLCCSLPSILGTVQQ